MNGSGGRGSGGRGEGVIINRKCGRQPSQIILYIDSSAFSFCQKYRRFNAFLWSPHPHPTPPTHPTSTGVYHRCTAMFRLDNRLKRLRDRTRRTNISWRTAAAVCVFCRLFPFRSVYPSIANTTQKANAWGADGGGQRGPAFPFGGIHRVCSLLLPPHFPVGDSVRTSDDRSNKYNHLSLSLSLPLLLSLSPTETTDDLCSAIMSIPKSLQ